MLEFIIEFFADFFVEIFLETTVGIPFKKFIEYISNKVKSKPLRTFIYILSSIVCIAVIIAIIAGIVYGVKMLSAN